MATVTSSAALAWPVDGDSDRRITADTLNGSGRCAGGPTAQTSSAETGRRQQCQVIHHEACLTRASRSYHLDLAPSVARTALRCHACAVDLLGMLLRDTHVDARRTAAGALDRTTPALDAIPSTPWKSC